MGSRGGLCLQDMKTVSDLGLAIREEGRLNLKETQFEPVPFLEHFIALISLFSILARFIHLPSEKNLKYALSPSYFEISLQIPRDLSKHNPPTLLGALAAVCAERGCREMGAEARTFLLGSESSPHAKEGMGQAQWESQVLCSPRAPPRAPFSVPAGGEALAW